MKKILKITGLILSAIIVTGFVILKFLGSRPAAPADYQQTVQAGGKIEKKYMADGPCKVSMHEDAVLQEFTKFIVYYPSEMETSAKKYPVIVMCNGSGTPLSKYPAVAEHMASWGFLVIGTEENYSWNAFGAEMCLRYLELWNENEKIEDTKSIFLSEDRF